MRLAASARSPSGSPSGSARTCEHANRGEHPLFACSLLCPAEKTEPRRLPRGIATFWWQPTHAARAETACGLCRARRRKTSVAKLKAPKPSACRFRGNNLRPALSGRSKNKTMQPPAPGTRAVGCSCSAASENADFSRRVSRRTTRQSKTAISTFCGKKVQRSLAGEDRGCPRSAASDNAAV